MRRNRGAVVATVAGILVVFGAIVALAASNVLIRREQERTQEQRELAELSQAQAEASATKVRFYCSV